jgi:hypothetical protein
MVDLKLSTPVAEPVDSNQSAITATSEAQLTASPNPFQNQVQLSLPEGQYQQVALFDATGQRQRLTELSAGQANLTWQTAGLQPGLYILRARSKTGAPFTKRLIKR